MIAAAVATVPLTISELQGERGIWLTAADWAVWAIFLIELIMLAYVASDRRAALRRNWFLTLIVVLTFPALPAIFQFARLSRLTRLARLSRLFAIAGRGAHAIGYAHARRGLLYVVTLCVFLIVAGGSIIEVVEPGLAEEGFWSGVWWAIVTTTTVGYGDISPETMVGRFIAVALMLAGIGLVSTLAATIATLFIGEQDTVDQAELIERLERIERTLEDLRANGDNRSCEADRTVAEIKPETFPQE